METCKGSGLSTRSKVSPPPQQLGLVSNCSTLAVGDWSSRRRGLSRRGQIGPPNPGEYLDGVSSHSNPSGAENANLLAHSPLLGDALHGLLFPSLSTSSRLPLLNWKGVLSGFYTHFVDKDSVMLSSRSNIETLLASLTLDFGAKKAASILGKLFDGLFPEPSSGLL